MVNKHPSSFKDPKGFIFFSQKKLLRSVSKLYKTDYNHLMKSGLYKKLTDENMLIKHKELKKLFITSKPYKILEPERIPFISYPYEWSFSQLKDAALLTLSIQKTALSFDMWLKDASAYNIQFLKGKPIFIDTLSFEKIKPNTPWVAYKQFCEHFLAPLLLIAYVDAKLSYIQRIFLDGIPLDFVAPLLPKRTYISIPLLIHIHLHAFTYKLRPKKTAFNNKQKNISKKSIWGLVENLEHAVKAINFNLSQSKWSNYYEDVSYTPQALQNKKALVSKFMKKTHKHIVWDMGANTGMFSKIALSSGAKTVIAFDNDFLSVEEHYKTIKQNKETQILPLVMDIINPSPNLGFNNKERASLTSRKKADCILALALLHHLTITNNIPFDITADYFKEHCQWLIIEFVPKKDPKVKKLLEFREDIFSNYSETGFEKIYKKYFKIISKQKIKESERTLYFMKRLL